jgi:acetyl esterase
MHWYIEHYLSGGEGARDDPRVSPLLAEDEALAHSPPTLVVTAELDPLLDEGEAYGRRLRAAGVETTVTRYDGMFHGFIWYADFVDGAQAALEEVAAALQRAFA